MENHPRILLKTKSKCCCWKPFYFSKINRISVIKHFIFGSKKSGSFYIIKLTGNIHAQGVTLNMNMTFGWMGVGRGFSVLALNLWQNNTFPFFTNSKLTFYILLQIKINTMLKKHRKIATPRASERGNGGRCT